MQKFLDKSKWTIVILLILALGSAVRFYQLGNPANGFYVDESALGYNAYSILKTGRDEFGKSFPVLFRSFADFKAPLYIYFSVIPIKIFGLSIFSTRFISAFAGSFTILIAYLFLRKITQQNLFSALVALVIAISPWPVYYSRGAWESNFSFFLLVSAAYLTYLGFTLKKRLVFLLGGVFFVLSAYAYHSQRIIAPLIFTYYLVIYRKWLFEKVKFIIAGFLILLVLSLPLIITSLTPGGQSRIKSTGYFSAQASLPWQNQNSTNNRLLVIFRKGAALYTAYFSPKNLFSPDPPEKQRWIVDISVFYSWQFIFFIVGIVCFFLKKDYSLLKRIVIPWLFLSPIAASLTGDPFASQRTLPLIFPYCTIIGLGIYESYLFLNQKISIKIAPHYPRSLLFSLFLLIIGTSVINLLIQLVYILPYQRAKYWEIGYPQLATDLLAYPDKKIVVDNSRGEGYIHLLFFTKFDPARYQKEFGYQELPDYYSSFQRVINKNFGQFEYRPIDLGKDISQGYIIAGDELMISPESIASNSRLQLLEEIKYPDQSVAYRIIEGLTN